MKGQSRTKGGGESSIPGRKQRAGTGRKEWCVGPGTRSSTSPDVKHRKGRAARNGTAEADRAASRGAV